MTVYLLGSGDSIDDEDAKDLRQNIEQKLAIGSLETVGSEDWWWTRPSYLVADTLHDVQRTIEKSLGKDDRQSFRQLRWVWWVFVEVVYLAIIGALFAQTSSKFETAVIAALVLIYNQVSGIGIGIGMIVSHLAQAAETIRWEFGHALKLKIPFAPVAEARKAIANTTGRNLLRMISLGIGSLIALWHLITAVLD